MLGMRICGPCHRPIQIGSIHKTKTKVRLPFRGGVVIDRDLNDFLHEMIEF